MAIVCTGSVAYDYLMKFPGLFSGAYPPGAVGKYQPFIPGGHLVRQRGGTAPNIAYTLALLGERPQLMATVGEDFAEYRAWLESHGVDTTSRASCRANTLLHFCKH